jgi:hypothetical protein
MTISAASPDGFLIMAPLASLLGVDWGQAAVVAALITLFGGLLLALLKAVGISMTTTREREHELYSEAVRAAVAWRELFYRVRRRANTEEAARELVDQFHDLQEQIDYYQAWTSSAGNAIGRSYCTLVETIKTDALRRIHEAWRKPGLQPGEEFPADEHAADPKEASDRFMKDVRRQLSFFFPRKLRVWWCNRDQGGKK